MAGNKDHVSLCVAAEYILDRMNRYRRKCAKLSGYLQVFEATEYERPLLTVWLGRREQQSSRAFPAEIMHQRISELFWWAIRGHPVPQGFTSSDIPDTLYDGGGVIVDELIFSFATVGDTNAGQHDEAITLMIAVRAGLLSRRKVYSLRCTPGAAKFNPRLRQLMDSITWSS